MNRLKELRKGRGLTQAEFGKIWGASQNTVSNWENGNRELSNDLLVQFAKFFSVSVDYLLGLEEDAAYEKALQDLGPNQRYLAENLPKLNEEQAKIFRDLMNQMGIK